MGFVVRRAPAYRVATRTLTGGFPSDRVVRAEFEKVAAWAKTNRVKAGSWFFRELDGPETPSRKRRWEVGIEVKTRRPLKGGNKMAVKVYPATTVTSVKFNPDQVSPMLVYSGMDGWMRWQRQEKKFRQNGPWREVYSGDPWKSRRAWANTEVQAPVKRLSH